jgi:hypothetical protein
MNVIDRIKATRGRNRKELEALAGLTGQTVAQVEADVCAPDPGGEGTSDLSAIPTSELLQDLEDTENDIVACGTALVIGVTEYGDSKSVQCRLAVNKQIRQVIRAELQRREA